MKFIKINLATYEYQDRKVSYPLLLCASVLVILLSVYLAQLWINNGDGVLRYEKRLSSLDQKPAPRDERVSEKAIYLPKDEADRIKRDAATLNHLILLDIFPWHHILDDLEKRTPSKITILELVSTKNLEGIRITGETHSIDVITLFLNNLEQSKILKHTILENLSVSQEEESPQYRENDLKIKFEIESRFDRQLFL